jgi:hypothetical protein
MSILETNKIQAFDGDNVTLSATNNIQVQADLYVTGAAQLTGNLTGTNAIFTGTVTAEEFIANTISSSVMYRSGSTKFGDSADDTHIITGGVYHTGQMVHTGDLKQQGISSVTGSFNISGSVNMKVPWPVVGEETHLVETEPFTLNLASGDRTYNYGAIALEHYENAPGDDHNAFKVYMYDADVVTPDFGSELLVGPVRIHMKMFASGSNSVADLSVKDQQNGQTQALMYADNIQIGVYNGDHIVFGNSTSSVTSSADTYHISSSLLHIITPDFELTGSAFISSTLAIGGVANVSSSISQNTTTTSNVSSSLALTITNLDTATSASDSALDTRVTTAEGHIENLHLFTGSLNDTYATDAELSAVSGALATSINTSVAGLNAASSSYALAADLTVATASIAANQASIGAINAATGSFAFTTGSIFTGKQELTGSIDVSGSISIKPTGDGGANRFSFDTAEFHAKSPGFYWMTDSITIGSNDESTLFAQLDSTRLQVRTLLTLKPVTTKPVDLTAGTFAVSGSTPIYCDGVNWYPINLGTALP